MTRSNFKKFNSKVLPPAILIFLLLLLWEAVVHFSNIKPYILPAPSGIVKEIISRPGLLLDHTLVTYVEIILGFSLGVFAGILLAILMSSIRILRLALQPILISSQTFPKEALAPLFIIWFGFGITSKVVITALICFFPICIGMLRGLDSADKLVLELFRVYNATPGQILLKLRIPASLPFLFSGLRVSATLSVIGAVVGEFVGASKGLGHLIRIANFQLSTELIFASLTLLGIIGMLTFLSVVFIENLLGKKFPHLKTQSNN